MDGSSTLKIRVTEEQEDLLTRLAGHMQLDSAAEAFAYIVEDALGTGPDAADTVKEAER